MYCGEWNEREMVCGVVQESGAEAVPLARRFAPSREYPTHHDGAVMNGAPRCCGGLRDF